MDAAPSWFASNTATTGGCKHCGNEVVPGSDFCCIGCEGAFALIGDRSLGRYYDLGGGTGHPIGALPTKDRPWLEPICERLRDGAALSRIDLDVQGVHCSACVWLIEELFERQIVAESGGGRVIVHPGEGRVELFVGPGFGLDAFVGTIERFGYRFGPGRRSEATRSDLRWRMGVCIAIAMNTMIFAVAIYAGLPHGRLYELFNALNFGLACISVAIGGTVFFRSAIAGLRSGVLHLDLPIALGIALAFASSAAAYFKLGSGAQYFDTLDVFIALMLVGRYLQERVLDANRRFLLESAGAASLFTRRVEDAKVTIAPLPSIRRRDRLLVLPGDLVPVEAKLPREGTFRLEWITGESDARTFPAGAIVPAGAFSANPSAMLLEAEVDFSDSTLEALLRAPSNRDHEGPRATAFWRRFARIYVIAVLTVGALSFGGWLLATGNVLRALEIVTAVLILTCPCAFGIATPLAYELVYAELRRHGLFVRSAGFIDRVLGVRRVVFDKTGTLTTGALTLANPDALGALAPAEADRFYTLAVQSSHPKAAAVSAELAKRGARFIETMTTSEHPGLGVEGHLEGRTYRIGAPLWVLGGCQADHEASSGDVALGANGESPLHFTTDETLRVDAVREVAELRRDGLEVFVLSGDRRDRVVEIARRCGIQAAHALGDRTPEEKAAWIEDGDDDVLMIGDGINDGLAVDAALTSGTPAIDRPFLAARSDFYFITPGLAPVGIAIRAGHALRKVVRRNLAVAVLYNALALGLAVAGVMSPLLCAVLMPVSSVSTVLATVISLSKGNSSWKSSFSKSSSA